MIFASLMSFQEALDSALARSLLPTSAKSAELARFDGAIKRRATFSATVESVEVLDELARGVEAILQGEATDREIRARVEALHRRLGTQPGPGPEGGIQDVTSRARIDLQVQTLTDTATGLGWHTQGMEEEVLDAYPAQELLRFFSPSDPDRKRDWAERWMQVGGRFFDGRMIALKTDAIWERLGSPSEFGDALGNPYPPFAFNSGMDVQDVSRAEAERLGLIDRATKPVPAPVDIAGDLRAGPEVRAAWLREAIEESGLGTFDADGVLHPAGGGA